MGTILLVDDDADLRLVTQLILKEAGYRVLTAGAGLEALQIAKEAGQDPDPRARHALFQHRLPRILAALLN